MKDKISETSKEFIKEIIRELIKEVRNPNISAEWGKTVLDSILKLVKLL